MARPKTVEVADRIDVVEADVDEVIRRRLAGEPFGTRNVDVPMREPGRWHTLEANTLADRNQHYSMRHVYGWEPVTMADLRDGTTPESIGWQVGDGGQLIRGGPGDPRLYKMLETDYQRVQLAKARANMKGTGSAQAVKAAMTESAGSTFGDEAAGFVQSNIVVTGADRVTGGAS